MVYPEPKMWRLDPVRGRMFIVPIAHEGYQDGYNAVVEDQYEVFTTCHRVGSRDAFLNQWLFTRRIRTYSKPLHPTFEEGEYECELCEPHWAKWPDGQRPDEILLSRVGEPPFFEVVPTPPKVIL